MRHRDQPSRAGVGTALVLLTGLLTGCGITHSALEVALSDGSSAAASAALAIRGLGDGDLTRAVAQTAVDDAVREISTAAADSAEYRAAPGRERRLQQRGVVAIAVTVRHLHRAQDRLSEPADQARLARILEGDRERLGRLANRAGELG